MALAGGDIHEVIRISSEERLIKFREAKAAEHGISEAEVCERIKASFVSDPRGFAPAIDPRRLLRYLLSYRGHGGFHEACVEQIFVDLRRRCAAERLTVQACFTRRGGIDINPWRSTEDVRVATPRPWRS
ncbi:MAG: hypothetical protein KC486_26410 [Myxococcales bacterium]|nr:hypothetical protein [Myxococcales bacterium]